MILTKIPAKKKNDVYLAITDASRIDGKVKRRTVKSLGYLSELKKQYDDPIDYFTKLAKQMTEEKKLNGGIKKIQIDFSTPFKGSSLYNCGSLLIKKFYDELKLPYIFRKIKDETKIKANIAGIFEYFVINQIIDPKSKLGSFENKNYYFKKYNFELSDVYRTLSYLNNYSFDIQKQILKNSSNICKRDFSCTYYDCTNYYFEIEVEDEFRKYGFSKEHRPNPIVQMGLFCDTNGIPMFYDLFKGSQNEQISMIPIEKNFVDEIKTKKLIVCADAGLCSGDNKYFNSLENKDYIFVQSLKKMKKYLNDEIFDENNDKRIKISDKFKYFTRPINDEIITTLKSGRKVKKDHEANLIITFDQDFSDYMKNVREKRIEKAKAIIANPSKYNKETSKDGKQYIKEISFDKNGEIVQKNLSLDTEKINEETKYDGYYALITSLINEKPEKIIKINKKRWQIEDCFRTLKSDLKARPVYLSLEERIRTHFLITYVSLTVLKLMQVKLRENLTHEETTIENIIDSLRNFTVSKIVDDTFKNNYQSSITKEIGKMFGLELDRDYFKSTNKIFRN